MVNFHLNFQPLATLSDMSVIMFQSKCLFRFTLLKVDKRQNACNIYMMQRQVRAFDSKQYVRLSGGKNEGAEERFKKHQKADGGV